MKGIGSEIISGPVGTIIGTILLMSVFGFATATINGWSLAAHDTGITNFERYDRVVKYDASKTSDETWAAVTTLESGETGSTTDLDANTAYKIATPSSGTACALSDIASAEVTAVDVITPSGTKLKVGANGQVGNCEWEKASPVLGGVMQGVINIILQAIGLAGPVVLLAIVGGFGSSVMRNVPAHPILKIIVMIILLLLVGYLVNVVLPFLSTAHQAIDPLRFNMYSTGIGRLSIVVADFFGVVLVAGLLSVGWTLWTSMRSGGSNVLAGGRM